MKKPELSDIILQTILNEKPYEIKGFEESSVIKHLDREKIQSFENINEIKENLNQLIKTTEILKQNLDIVIRYTIKISDNQDLTEDYLKQKLSTDWEQFKDIWSDYNNGKITKRNFIKDGISILGPKFIKVLFPV